MKKGLIYQKYTLTGRSNINSNTPSGKAKLNKFILLQFYDFYEDDGETIIPVTDIDLEVINDLDTSEMAYPIRFSGCTEITTVPEYDTSGAVSLSNTFDYCPQLINVPQFNAQNVLYINYMFSSASVDNLSDESLDNIMATCISATNLAPNQIKSLQAVLGWTNNMQLLERCVNLSNYQAFLNAGWTLYDR